MAVADDLMAQVAALSKQPSTKAEIIQYYQQQYPARGAGSWKQQLVNDLARITGMKPKNLERRFDPSRINNVPRTTREKDQYVQLGDQIGPRPPGGLLIDFDGEIRISDKCYPRKFGNLYLDEDEAADLLATGDFHIIMEEYFQGNDISEDLCGDPAITIRPAGAGARQRTFKHEMHGPSRYASILKK